MIPRDPGIAPKTAPIAADFRLELHDAAAWLSTELPSDREPAGMDGSGAGSVDVVILHAVDRLTEPELDAARRLLPAKESASAAGISHPMTRIHRIIGRALLLREAGRRLGVGARELELQTSPAGKPALRPPGNGLHVGLAHAGPYVVAALSRRAPVGIDIEPIDQTGGLDDVRRRLFTPREHATLEALAPETRTALTLRRWTHLEARLKATGQGLPGWDEMPGLPAGSSWTWVVRQSDNQAAWRAQLMADDRPDVALGELPPGLLAIGAICLTDIAAG